MIILSFFPQSSIHRIFLINSLHTPIHWYILLFLIYREREGGGEGKREKEKRERENEGKREKKKEGERALERGRDIFFNDF